MGETTRMSNKPDAEASPEERIRAYLSILIEEDLSDEARKVLRHLLTSDVQLNAIETNEMATLLVEGLP
jgi:hypothetical protein